MLNVDRASRTVKGSPRGGFVSLQSLTDDHGNALEPRTNETPEEAFARVLRRSVFKRLLSAFESGCLGAGQEKKYQLFFLHEIRPRMEGTAVPTYSNWRVSSIWRQKMPPTRFCWPREKSFVRSS